MLAFPHHLYFLLNHLKVISYSHHHKSSASFHNENIGPIHDHHNFFKMSDCYLLIQTETEQQQTN